MQRAIRHDTFADSVPDERRLPGRACMRGQPPEDTVSEPEIAIAWCAMLAAARENWSAGDIVREKKGHRPKRYQFSCWRSD
eukprot:1930729-Prymnesium_polylepis.1